MALLATDRLLLDVRAILRSTSSSLSSNRIEYAARLALVASLAALVAEIFQTPNIALTAYLAFFVVKADRVESILISLVFTILIAIVISAIFLLAANSLDYPAWRVFSMAGISFVLLYATSATQLKPVSSTIALVAAYALDLLGGVPGGETATRTLLYAWLFIAIPAGISITVNLLIGPAPRRLVMRALARRLLLTAESVREPDAARLARLDTVLLTGLGEILGWLKLAALEKTTQKDYLVALQKAALSTNALMLMVHGMREAPINEWSDFPRQELASRLREMALIFESGAYPVEIDLIQHPGALTCASRELLSRINCVLISFACPLDFLSAPANRNKNSFFVANAFSDPTHLRFALKATGAAMFCYLTYSVLNYPAIHTCLITCYIVALSTVAESLEKLILRLGGAAIGAIMGTLALVYIIPGLDSIGTLLIVVFAGAFCAALIAGGSPRISYAGFQLAFAFFLSVIQGPSPKFDLTLTRDRLIGILFGNVVVYLFFSKLWPMSISRRIDPALAVVTKLLARLATTANLEGQLVLASDVVNKAAVVGQDLHLAGYEPSQLRRSSEWLATRQHLLASAVGIDALLLCHGASTPASISKGLSAIGRALGDEHEQVPSDVALAEQDLQPTVLDEAAARRVADLETSVEV